MSLLFHYLCPTMKHTTTIFIAILLWAGCAPKHVLQLETTKIPVGRAFLYRQTTETETEMAMSSLDVASGSNETSTVDFTLTLDHLDPNGTQDWTIQVLRYQHSETKGDVVKTFDSTKPLEAGDPDSIKAAIFGVLDSISYRLTVDAQGNILKKLGFDDIWIRAEETMPVAYRPMFKEVAKQFKKQGTLDFSSQLWSFFPKKPIKKGKSWKREEHIHLLNINKEMRFALVDSDASTHKIAIATQMPENPGNPGELAVGPIKIYYRMGGSGTGSVVLDRRWNMAQSYYAEDLLTGTMETKVPFLGSNKIPITIRTKSRLELVSK
jgi:hypothetical protein